MTVIPWVVLKRTFLILPPLLALLLGAGPAHSQNIGVDPLVTLTGELEDRARLSQLTGKSSAAGFLLRSSSRLMPFDTSSDVWRIGVVGPEIRTLRNSGLPFSMNDGALWAGRGWNATVTAGVFAERGPIRLIIAPTFIAEQNRAFQVIPYPQVDTDRSVWANPFHPLPESIDLPLRFGDRSRRRVDPGQSSLTATVNGIAFGLATENLWWGPGIRNAITLSNNAAGFPHGFVELRPRLTTAGTFHAQLVLGQLSESGMFDQNSSNNSRTVNGLAMTWAPTRGGITLGAARLVMAAHENGKIPASAVFDVLRSVGHANVDSSTTPVAHGRDQITSLFGRWVLPSAGFEAYLEWARFEEPLSLRDLMEYPGHSEGYTLGLQWAHPLAAERTFRLQGEASYLEPDPSLRLRPVATTYTSRSVPQGFTNRGETLGAAIGPGGSSQWLAGDVFERDWRLGAYLGRIRWDNGVLFEPIVPQLKRQDVSLFAGLRGSVSWQGVNVLVDFAHAARFDYLFQAAVLAPGKTGGVDLLNNTLSVTLSTAIPTLSRRDDRH